MSPESPAEESPSEHAVTRILMLPDLEATHALAGQLAPHLAPGLRIGLRGGLGAGKTTFVRALLSALGHRGRVRSPTFTLHEPYQVGERTIHHFDLYRFADPAEWVDAGFDELLNGPALSLIEWPEQAQGVLPPTDIDLLLEPMNPDGPPALARANDAPETAPRRVRLTAQTDKGQACLRDAGL